jgi:hypothetical protein
MGNAIRQIRIDPVTQLWLVSAAFSWPLALLVAFLTDTWLALSLPTAILTVLLATFLPRVKWFRDTVLPQKECVCLGCNTKIRYPTILPRASVCSYTEIANIKLYCLNRDTRIVCRACYTKTPDERHWKQRFGGDHEVRDVDQLIDPAFTKKQANERIAAFIQTLDNKTPVSHQAINQLRNAPE